MLGMLPKEFVWMLYVPQLLMVVVPALFTPPQK
jgi:hypothetical protein